MTAVTASFLATSALVILSPGPDAVLTVHLVLRTGRRAPACAGAAGMLTAGAGHAALALSGVSLALRTDPAAWTALRWAGALVLFGWGLSVLAAALRPNRASGGKGPPGGSLTLRRCYGLGVLSTGSNPKVGVFLLAYLPQFVGPHDPPQRTMALLAGVYLAIAAGWLALLVVATDLARRRGAGRARGSTARAARRRSAVEGLLGLVFIGFAVRLALLG
ncbi:LysE family translocator [Actinacidiphila acididurans]|uniref:LysE family transporter n=1 Tax=Actinacidiphila acididurans TaxID=2784346 RepID=A0ABS2U508_9ACTN|nr:LysE family transporter [Actinacidiphila acididurans]MBM9510082.1 LysE family transporter [Actinacidiphila acididurans]